MTSGNGERSEKVNKGIEPKPQDAGIDIAMFPSAQPIEQGLGMEIVGDIVPEMSEFNSGEAPVKIEGGIIKIDKKALEIEKQKVIEEFKTAINAGDESLIKRYMWFLEDREDQEGIEIRKQLEEAIRNRDASNLQFDALHIGLPSESIAQRKLIREGLKPEMSKYPFRYKDKNGKVLDLEDDVDFVFTPQGVRGTDFKFIVASKKGIEGVAISDNPGNLPSNVFEPDLNNIDRDPTTGKLILHVKKAKDGTSPSVDTIEVLKGAIDLPAQLLKEEEEQERKKKRPQSTQYTPPPASPPPSSRSQRSTSWVSASH